MTKISNQYSLTNVLFADAVNGRVGVNNASPTVALDVTGAGLFSSSLTTGGAIFTTNNTPFDTAGSITRHSVVGLALKAVTASVFDFSLYSAGGTALMTNPTGTNNINFNSGQVWFNGSNVGIGTSSPLNKFTVVGVSSFQLSEANDIRLIINPTASGINISSTYNTNGSYQPITISTSDTERMRIHPNGTKYFGAFNSSRLQINPSGEQVLSYTNNYYIWGIFNDSNSVAIESAFAGDIIFRAQAQSTSSSPTTAAERMRITSGGNVGIGITGPANLLSVRGTIDVVSTTNAPTTSYLRLGTFPDGRWGSYVSADSNYNGELSTNLKLGTNLGGTYYDRMTVSANGSIGAPSGTNIYNASDARLKRNIETIDSGLNKVMALNPVKFNWIENYEPSEEGKDMLGFIAQEVLLAVPEAVENFASNKVIVDGQEIDDVLRVNEKFIIPVLVKAIQELSAQASEQQTQINELKALLNA